MRQRFLVRSLRVIKSPAEIEKLRHICSIGSATFAEVPTFIDIGMPLEEVLSISYYGLKTAQMMSLI